MRFATLILLLSFLFMVPVSSIIGDTVEGIYAIVNDEIITYSELENFKNGMMTELKSRFSGKELTNEINKMKSNLLDLVIGRKVILSKAKEKKYDMSQYLDIVIEDIMKRNNIATKEDLIKALNSQGISYDEFKKQRLEQLMQEKFIQESLGTRINVDTSEIISYYKKNISKYTAPVKYKLNCIFLNKEHYFTDEAISVKKKEIAKKISISNDFISVAKKFSELEGTNNNYELGTFSKGELDSALEKSASKLLLSKFSDWIETDNGWYIIQLADKTLPMVKEYKSVKKDIENKIYEKKRGKEIKLLVEELKNESYIKIIKEFK